MSPELGERPGLLLSGGKEEPRAVPELRLVISGAVEARCHSALSSTRGQDFARSRGGDDDAMDTLLAHSQNLDLPQKVPLSHGPSVSDSL